MVVGKASASGRWELPALAMFVIDCPGTIRYAFADGDYERRATR